MVATVGGCPPNGAVCTVKLALFSALLSAACALPLSYEEVNNNNENISMKHSDLAADTVSEVATVDTVFVKASSSPPRDLNDDAHCDLNINKFDAPMYADLSHNQQVDLRNLNAADFSPVDVQHYGNNTAS